jgi:hypothetical protein
MGDSLYRLTIILWYEFLLQFRCPDGLVVSHTLNVYAAQTVGRWSWKRSSRGETKTAVELAGWRGCCQESRAGALEV